jgi:uncharacterized protein
MEKQKRVIFHIGGPAFHPVKDQAHLIAQWLGQGYQCEFLDGVDAFEGLDECDLLVVMGLHWTGMVEGESPMVYRPMLEHHQRALETYVASGRPVLSHHGGIASYDDWPRFGELLGFTWVWGETSHSPFGEYHVSVRSDSHPITKGLQDFTVQDELYYNVRVASGFRVDILAEAGWEGQARPMIFVGQGGRTPGAGRTVYLANGHDLRTFEAPEMRRLWLNTMQWLTGEVSV